MTAKTEAGPRYHTPTEIARMLRVGDAVVRGWIRNGKLKAIDVSTAGKPKYRITPSDFKKFEESLVVTGLSEAISPQRKRKSRVPHYCR